MTGYEEDGKFHPRISSVITPQYDLVAVFTAGGFNAESTPPNTIMAKIILPALIAAHNRDKNRALMK